MEDIQFLGMIVHRSYKVCVKCRVATRTTLTCGHEPTYRFGPRWRPPKKNNDKAWKRIERGEYLWDEKALMKFPSDYPYNRDLSAEPGVPLKIRKRNPYIIAKNITERFRKSFEN